MGTCGTTIEPSHSTAISKPAYSTQPASMKVYYPLRWIRLPMTPRRGDRADACRDKWS
jgi:hypothetical protein